MNITHIKVRWLDPLDEQELCSATWSYNIRRAAMGWYSKEIKRLTDGYKRIFSDILEGRTPKTETTLLRIAARTPPKRDQAP